MRTVATVLLGLVATLATVVAIGATWTTLHIQREDGFVELVSQVGNDPEVQRTAADLAGEAFADQPAVPTFLHDRAAAAVSEAIIGLTSADGWSDAWQESMRRTHQRLYGGATPTDVQIDVAPLVSVAMDEVSANLPLNLGGPDELWVTISEEDPADLVKATAQAGATAVVSGGLAVIAALLAMAVSRRRSITLAALGLGVVLAAGGWWVAARLGLPPLVDRSQVTPGNARALQDVLIDRLVGSLDVTLAWTAVVGAAMIAVGLFTRALRS